MPYQLECVFDDGTRLIRGEFTDSESAESYKKTLRRLYRSLRKAEVVPVPPHGPERRPVVDGSVSIDLVTGKVLLTINGERYHLLLSPGPVRYIDLVHEDGKDAGVVYTLSDGSCECPDSNYRPGVVCKHRVAIEMAVRLIADLAAALPRLPVRSDVVQSH